MQRQQGVGEIALIFIMMLLVGAGGYYLGMKHPFKNMAPQVSTASPQSTSIPAAKDEAANWKTYTNTKYKFSLKYPNTWYVAEDEGTIYINNGPIPDPPITHGVPGSLTIFTSPTPFDKPDTEKGQIISDTTILGIKAIKIIDKNEYMNEFETSFIVNYKEKGYWIIFPNNDSSGNYNPIFDQILSTFRFN